MGVKPLEWVGSSKRDLKAFPRSVQREIGYALHFAQMGTKHPAVKPLAGFHGAGVLEVAEDFEGDTYRAVYTVRFARTVYVLHAFQKKSKKGIATAKKDIELVRSRMKWAESAYKGEQGI